MRYFKVMEEGEEDGIFFPEEAEARKMKEGNKGTFEPKVKWRKSKAKRILYDFLRDGTIPLVQTDIHGNETMSIDEILNSSSSCNSSTNKFNTPPNERSNNNNANDLFANLCTAMEEREKGSQTAIICFRIFGHGNPVIPCMLPMPWTNLLALVDVSTN
jgi:hypothetical protein